MLTLETKPGCRLLLVEVPEDAETFQVIDGNMLVVDHQPDWDELPPGSFEFIATTDTLTEQQAAQHVEKEQDYETFTTYRFGDITSLTPRSAFRNALTEAGAALDKTYAILKQLP